MEQTISLKNLGLLIEEWEAYELNKAQHSEKTRYIR